MVYILLGILLCPGYCILITKQVLRCVNPSISYTDPKTRVSVSGVAMSLNLFLKHLDGIGIEHPSADIIRKCLHRRERAVIGRYKRYFLTGKSKDRKITRSGPHSKTHVKCRTSVAIPKDWVSEHVYNFLIGVLINTNCVIRHL